MKAFELYAKEEIDLRLLIDKLEKSGKCNCSFEIFQKIYTQWHQSTFPGVPVSIASANFRDDWFSNFVNYIANTEITMTQENSFVNPNFKTYK